MKPWMGVWAVLGLSAVTTVAARDPVPGPTATLVRPIEGENLLINGSFESPPLPPGGWQVFQAIPGWVAVDGPGIEIQRGAAGPAPHGAQLAELDSHGNSAMVQAVAVQPGVEYELRFWTQARPGTAADTNGLDVWINGVRVHQVRHGDAVDAPPAAGPHGPVHDELPPHLRALRPAAPTFQEVRLRWTAGPDVTQAVLRLAATGASDGLGSYIDNVSWRAVTALEVYQ